MPLTDGWRQGVTDVRVGLSESQRSAVWQSPKTGLYLRQEGPNFRTLELPGRRLDPGRPLAV